MADWVTISSLGTAGGTLVLAVATFASVRSANATARVAERSLQAGLRPVLVPSRENDPSERIGFGDRHWVVVEGHGAVAEIVDDRIYMALGLRNAGAGLAVLHSWRVNYDRTSIGADSPDPDSFRRLSRDIYVPAGDSGFWQGAIRNPEDPDYQQLRERIEADELFGIDLMYGDHEGGQRTISRFSMTIPEGAPHREGAVIRYWNLDRENPR